MRLVAFPLSLVTFLRLSKVYYAKIQLILSVGIFLNDFFILKILF